MAQGGWGQDRQTDWQPAPYKCTLSPQLLKLAEEELREKAAWRDRDIQALRDMVKAHYGLVARQDDAFLLRFLRAKKFDYERADQMLFNYYKIRANNTDYFKNLTPSSVRHVLETGVTGVLPLRDQHGRRVILFRPGRWSPDKIAIVDVMRTNVTILEKLIQEEETQVNGIVMLADFRDVGWSHIRKMTPAYAKIISSILQDAFPARFKGIHLVNNVSIMGYVFSIMKPFLKDKTAQRLDAQIHFHGTSMEKLHEYISPDVLPCQYGGRQPPFSNKEWTDEILAGEAEFLYNMQFGFQDESSAQCVYRKNKSDEAVECLMGGYIKLNTE